MIYSGGRDGCVYRTHLASRTAELLVQEEQPVRKLALDQQVGGLMGVNVCALGAPSAQ